MSVSTEVQRTLVKSPPELWAELSDSETLARHLGGFGTIRITNAEPEAKVEWEADEASGIVQLKQSGWGTRVTLSVTRNPHIPEPPAPEPAAIVEPEPEPEPAPEPVATVEPEPVSEPEPTPGSDPVAATEPAPTPEPDQAAAGGPEPTLEPSTAVEPEPAPDAAAPEPRPGFFARLFRKRQTKQAALTAPPQPPEPNPIAATEPVPAPEPEPEVVALAAPEPLYPDPPAEPEVDLNAELEAVEAQMEQETTALLTGVLDRLGSAHHRPFSRG